MEPIELMLTAPQIGVVTVFIEIISSTLTYYSFFSENAIYL